MKRWIPFCLAMTMAMASGCDKKSKRGGDDDDDGDGKPSRAQESPDKSASPGDGARTSDAKGKSAEVDPRKLLEEDDSEASGVLDVKLPDDDKRDAPSLGGASAPPVATPGAQLRWLGAGAVQVPNPGWQEIPDPPAMVLLSPDKKAGIVFAPFSTPKDGTDKVDRVVAHFKLKNAKWKKAKQVKVGPDQLPAFFGSGSAVTAKNEPVKLHFALIKTGGPENLVAIGIADADTPEHTLKQGLGIVTSIKRK